MKHRVRKLSTVVVATSMALASGPSWALVEDALPTMPPGGWGYEPGIAQGAGRAAIELPGVTVTGKRDNSSTFFYQIYVPIVMPPGNPKDPSGPAPSTTVDPIKQKACMDTCDTNQKLANDLCATAAAKASAAGTTAAIGIGFAAGSLLTWKASMLFGAAGGFAAYQAVNTLAKDHAATMNLACIGKAALDHSNCIKGNCKFTG